MAPKTDAKAAKPKTASAAPAHASYQDMIKDAILKLKERNGSSRQAIKKYVKANNNLGSATENQFVTRISKAIKTGVENGVFDQPKGASGPLKLKKPGDKAPKSAKSAAKPKADKKDSDAEKKPAGEHKAAPAKKDKPATAKKPAAKKAAAPKKAAADKKPKALKAKPAGVTKTKAPPKKKAAAPADKKAPAKKAPTKKAPAKKAAAAPPATAAA